MTLPAPMTSVKLFNSTFRNVKSIGDSKIRCHHARYSSPSADEHGFTCQPPSRNLLYEFNIYIATRLRISLQDQQYSSVLLGTTETARRYDNRRSLQLQLCSETPYPDVVYGRFTRSSAIFLIKYTDR